MPIAIGIEPACALAINYDEINEISGIFEKEINACQKQ